MKPIRTTLALTLAVALLSFTACDKGNLVSNAEQALKYAKLAQPTIARLLPGSANEYSRFVGELEKLVPALKANDTTAGQALLDSLLPVFNEIVDKRIAGIADANVRTILMTALALVDVYLHKLVDNILKSAPPSVANAREASTIKAFAARESWGRHYKQP